MKTGCVSVPHVPWPGQSGPCCGSEASPLELAQLGVVTLGRTARLAAADPGGEGQHG